MSRPDTSVILSIHNIRPNKRDQVRRGNDRFNIISLRLENIVMVFAYFPKHVAIPVLWVG